MNLCRFSDSYLATIIDSPAQCMVFRQCYVFILYQGFDISSSLSSYYCRCPFLTDLMSYREAFQAIMAWSLVLRQSTGEVGKESGRNGDEGESILVCGLARTNEPGLNHSGLQFEGWIF